MIPSNNRPSTARPRILFAAPTSWGPTDALLRAWALSQTLDAELHLLGVSASTSTGAVETQQAEHQILEHCQRWCTDWLPTQFEGQSWAGVGGFVSEVTARSQALGATMIIVPPGEGQFGAGITALAEAGQIPVLVARPSTGGQTVLVATDLRDDTLPVVTHTAALSQRLGSRLIALHNLGHTTSLASLVALKEWLRQTASSLNTECALQVTHATNADEAILGAARELVADIVVLGTASHAWADAFRPRRVCERVIEKAKRSVLVLPQSSSRGAPSA